jgi:microsomal epoxide hydrolase
LEAGKGLTLILIPGWLLPAEIWKSQLEDLSGDYHVVALDPRSQGRSEITPKGDEPLRQAKDIQELLDHLKVNSAVLVGWSHGSFQVLAYMGEFGTDRLYGAVLVDSALAAASSAAISTSRTKFLNGFRTNRLAKRHPSPDFIRLLTDSAMKTPTDIAMTLMNSAFPGDPYQPSIPVMRQIPLLYAITPKFTAQSQYLLQVFPLSRVEFFQNTGHALFVDDPEHFNDTLRDFLHHCAVYPAGLPEPKRKPVPSPTPYH